MTPTSSEQERIVASVRDRYAQIAGGQASGCGCCCDSSAAERDIAERIGYTPSDLDALPAEANLGLGCGAPIALLDLQPGETVLDLGSGAGIDALLAARAVGPAGHVIGVDMTPEMLARARQLAEQHGAQQVEFRHGRLEALPIESASIDAITSNCVINLVPDKDAVFREAVRVLRPGGRLVVSDIVLDGELPAAIANDVMAWTGCIAGAERRERYFERLAAAGFSHVTILRELDYGVKYAEMTGDSASQLLARFGLSLADIQGVVSSVTYRAQKTKP
jgi:SAM-dependent methyltransferase